MHNNSCMKDIELLCVIVNLDLGSKVIKIAKQNGVSGGTIFLGKGTIKNSILEFFALSEVNKEVVIMLSEKTTAYKALDELDRVFAFHKPNHGIAFSTSVSKVLGIRTCKGNDIKVKRGVENIVYNAIFVVVDKGNAEAVIEAATKVGSRGGTIINARGSGIHESSKLFLMDIEPEKEIVLILSDIQLTDKITSSINEHLKLDDPGNGILFVQDVNKTYGLY